MTTLIAYAPNGLKITHEYWLRPYTAEVDFILDSDVEEEDDGYVAPGICADVDYGSNEEEDIRYEAGDRRWMDEDGNLWPNEDLTFKEE